MRNHSHTLRSHTVTALLVTSVQPIREGTNRGGRGCQTLHFFMCDPNVSRALIIYTPTTTDSSVKGRVTETRTTRASC